MPQRTFALILCLFLYAAHATAALQLAPGLDHVALDGKLEYLEDPTRQLTLQDITKSDAVTRFSPPPARGSLNFGYSASAYWLRLPLLAENGAERQWLLEFAYPSLDSVEVFVPDGKGGYSRQQAGDHQPFSSRPYPHKNLVFPVMLVPDQKQTLYVRVVSNGNLTLPAALWTQEALHQNDLRTYPVFALYYGALGALAIYNLLLYFLIRDRRHIEYVAFAACMIVG